MPTINFKTPVEPGGVHDNKYTRWSAPLYVDGEFMYTITLYYTILYNIITY